MNLNINNEKLTIEDKTYALLNIDFILNNGKTRIYFKDGTSKTVFNNYTAEERLLCFLDVAHAVSSINQNFIIVKEGVLLNLNNIKSLSTTSAGVNLKTKGFDFQLIELSTDQINLINHKIAENKLLESAILL